MIYNRLAAAAALGLVGGALLLASPAQAEGGYYPPAGWLVQDTTIGADVDWSDCDPGPVRVDSVLSAIVDATHVGLTGTGVVAPPHYGTSIETTDLGLPVEVGDLVTVDYVLLEGASPTAGAVRLFLYGHADADTDCTGPAAFVAAPDDGTTSGTLTIRVPFDGVIGTAGMVYDSSNGGVGGTVRFSDLTVNDELVLFVPPADPDPLPSATPTTAPTTDPSDEPGRGDDDQLAVTGFSWRGLVPVGGILAVVGAGLLFAARRQRRRFTAE